MVDTTFTVTYPNELAQLPDGSALYGYRHADTQSIVIVGNKHQSRHQPRVALVGWLERSKPIEAQECPSSDGVLLVQRDGDQLIFELNGTRCQGTPYSLEQDLFSRNTGLLETSLMRQTGVIVCGCGSVGSLAALELARSGVGRFLLIDPELLAIENLCRHQGGLADVGRRKVEAVAERIHQINPRAEVEVQNLPIERLDPARIAAFVAGADPQQQKGDTLMLACADSRRADRQAARLAALLQLPFLSIGLWERAFAGEIFYSHPGEPMPCYGCAFEGVAQTMGTQPEPRRRFYTTEAELEKLDFQPGIGIDIAFVTQIGLKLAIDLLNRDNPQHVPRLLGKLSQFTLVCNSNDPRLGGERAEIFSHPLQVTSSIQVGYGQGCPPCRWTS